MVGIEHRPKHRAGLNEMVVQLFAVKAAATVWTWLNGIDRAITDAKSASARRILKTIMVTTCDC